MKNAYLNKILREINSEIKNQELIQLIVLFVELELLLQLNFQLKHVMDVVKGSKKKLVFYVKNKLESINYLDVIYVQSEIISLSVLIVINLLRRKNELLCLCYLNS